jgi:hypothetical protein
MAGTVNDLDLNSYWTSWWEVGRNVIVVHWDWWKEPVDTITSLPTTWNTTWDLRMVTDTMKLYEWNGSVWSEFTTSAVWGALTWTLSNQTDLQNALNAKAGSWIYVLTTQNSSLTNQTNLWLLGSWFIKSSVTWWVSTISIDTNTYLTSLTGAVLTSQATPQTIWDTTNRLTKLWVTDITCTNAITGSVTGNAWTVTTNANLTGTVTSVWNATSIASWAIKANMLQATATDLGAADVTIDLSNTNASYVTNLSTDWTITATAWFSWNVTWNVSWSSWSCTGNAATVTNWVYTTGWTLTGALNIEHADWIVLGKDETGWTPNIAWKIKMYSSWDDAYYNTFTSWDNTANATYTLPVAMPAVTWYVLSCTDAWVMSWEAIPWWWDMLLWTEQSVTALKTFDKDKISMKGTSTWTTVISTANTWTTSYTQTMQARDWTLANLDNTFYIWTTEIALNRSSAALTLAWLTLTTPNIWTPSAWTLTNCTWLPISWLTASTATAIGVWSIELWHASDTSITRVSAWVVAIEWSNIMTVWSTDTVTGTKTFNKDKIAMKGTSTWINIISVANTSATSYTNTIPAKDWTFAMTTDITIDWSWTTNQITYWVDSNTLWSLAVATYPSLAELAYVKWVTGWIQSQLNAKGVWDMLLWTVQSVTAEKKFTNDKITLLWSSTGKTVFHSLNDSATDYQIDFKKASWTVAFTTDIVSQVEDNITDWHTTIAPSWNAVFDALALKANLTTPTFVTSITTPSVLATANDSGALGASWTAFSDLFLASGAVINFDAWDITLTHSSNTLTLWWGNLALWANNLTMTWSLGATGAWKLTKIWAADAEFTNLPTINWWTLATALSLGTMASETATNYVAKSLYDANTILYATSDNTPLALTVWASTIVWRKATWDIVALTGAEALAITWWAATGQTFYIWTTQVAINRSSAALTLAWITLTTPDIWTPSAWTLTNCTWLPIAWLTASTSTALWVWSIELWHASDTTITRTWAWVIAVEWATVITSTWTTSWTILKNNWTTFVASTETYAAPWTSWNVMTSDWTNWISTAPAWWWGWIWNIVAWTPVYASATTFTVTWDYTTTFKKGIVIKWLEDSTQRCAMVSIPSTESWWTTTVTVIWDAVVNGAGKFSTVKYSWVALEKKNFAMAWTYWTTWTDVMNAYYAEEPFRVIWAELSLWTVATTWAEDTFTIDINKEWTWNSLFTTKPTIEATVLHTDAPFTADTAAALALNDRVTVDIDVVPTTPWSDVYVKLYVVPTRLLSLS